MPDQGKSLGPGHEIPGQCRQGALRRIRRWNCALDCRAQQAFCDRCDVGIDDHRIRIDELSGCELHAGSPAIPDGDFGRFRSVVEFCTAGRGQFCDRDGQPMHATLYQPHSVAFDVCNEHERGRCKERGRSAVSRIATEKLPQARVMEVISKRAPERGEGRYAPEFAELVEADFAREVQGIAAR